jgi:hypothetical protein
MSQESRSQQEDPDSEARRLAARYSAGQDAGPLVRALLGGLAGAVAALILDRLLPSGELAVFMPSAGAAEALPSGMLLPSLAADLLVGDPHRLALGATAFCILMVLATFIFGYGQFRRFVPAVDSLRGLAWSILLWFALAPSLLARALPWLAAGPASGADAGAAFLAASWLILESLACLAAYGLVVGWSNPSPDAG